MAPALPAAVDNSTTIWFPPVRNQGSNGSCVFFSQTYYTMSYLVNRSLNRDGRDPADNTTKMSPRFTYNIQNGGQDSGGGPTDGFKVMAKHGTPTWAEFPYTTDYKGLPTTAAIWRSALRHRIGQIGQITGMNTAEGREMAKQMLADGYLLNYTTFIDAWKNDSMKTLRDNPASTLDDGIVGNRVVTFTDKTGGGPHAMTIVGYNDYAWSDINANGRVDEYELGAFKVVNSWGTGWGTGGFAWIAYDALGVASRVPGANQPTRNSTSVLLGDKVYWAKLRQDSTPTLVAEIDLTTAQRGGFISLFNAGETTQTVMPQPDFAVRDAQSVTILGNLSFAGTTSEGQATIAFDLSSLADGGTVRRWFFQTSKISDITKSSVIRGFRLTDGDGNVLGTAGSTAQAGGLPATLSPRGSEVTAWIDLQVPDPAPPAAITDLAVVGASPTSVTLAFTTTGDDGARGYVSTYDVRRSGSVITAATIGSATARSVTLDTPTPAGVDQRVTVDGLAPGATVFFAVRGIDDAGKSGAISNVVRVTLPTTLAATATLPPASVGSAYSAALGVSGGTAPRTWALTPTMTETTGSGGTMVPGTRYDIQNAEYRLPFSFPIQYPDGVRQATSIRINREGGSLVFPDTAMVAVLGSANVVGHVVFSRQIEYGGTGEGVFIDGNAERVAVRWRAHPRGVTGQTGSLEFQATLFPDGSTTFTYAAIDQSSLPDYNRATIGIRHPEIAATSQTSWTSVRSGAATIPAGATSRWTPTRLPPGLSLDSMTGVISGTPTTAGTWTIPITITDSGVPAQRVAITTTITVQAGGTTNQPPVVTKAATVAQGVMVMP